jgi:hypothetical protein
MAFLMLYGVGWTQRWQIADDALALVSEEIKRVGRSETGFLPVIDPGSGGATTVAVAWQHVAAAALLGADHRDGTEPPATGQYA